MAYQGRSFEEVGNRGGEGAMSAVGGGRDGRDKSSWSMKIVVCRRSEKKLAPTIPWLSM